MTKMTVLCKGEFHVIVHTYPKDASCLLGPWLWWKRATPATGHSTRKGEAKSRGSKNVGSGEALGGDVEVFSWRGGGLQTLKVCERAIQCGTQVQQTRVPRQTSAALGGRQVHSWLPAAGLVTVPRAIRFYSGCSQRSNALCSKGAVPSGPSTSHRARIQLCCTGQTHSTRTHCIPTLGTRDTQRKIHSSD